MWIGLLSHKKVLLSRISCASQIKSDEIIEHLMRFYDTNRVRAGPNLVRNLYTIQIMPNSEDLNLPEKEQAQMKTSSHHRNFDFSSSIACGVFKASSTPLHLDSDWGRCSPNHYDQTRSISPSLSLSLSQFFFIGSLCLSSSQGPLVFTRIYSLSLI